MIAMPATPQPTAIGAMSLLLDMNSPWRWNKSKLNQRGRRVAMTDAQRAFIQARLRRPPRHATRIRRLATWRQRLARLAGPQLAFVVARVVGEPDFRLALDIQKVPMEVIPRQVKLLL